MFLKNPKTQQNQVFKKPIQKPKNPGWVFGWVFAPCQPCPHTKFWSPKSKFCTVNLLYMWPGAFLWIFSLFGAFSRAMLRFSCKVRGLQNYADAANFDRKMAENRSKINIFRKIFGNH